MQEVMQQILQLVHWLLITLGLTYLLTQSSVFYLVRAKMLAIHPLLGQLVYCPACSGFWIGATTYFYAWPFHTWLGALDSAIAACGLMATWANTCLGVTSWEIEQQHAAREETEH